MTSGNALYAKRFRYWASYLKSYPIPDLAHPRDVTIVKQIIKNTSKLVKISDEQEIANMESENDRLIYRLFGLTNQEIEELEYFLSFKYQMGISKRWREEHRGKLLVGESVWDIS